jgi:putative aldouronate transport system substrate-binding protein
MKKAIPRLSLVLLLASVTVWAGGTAESGGPAPAAGVQAGPLVIWVAFDRDSAATISSFNQIGIYSIMQEKTGVKVTYRHPPLGQENEQFNLMVASRDLPDVIETTWLTYPGGPEKAFSDRIIIKHNDLFAKNSPTLKTFLDSRPDLNKQIKTDAGNYYGWPSLVVSNYKVNYTETARKDWLDDLGIAPPETLDEWAAMLAAFRDKKGAVAPLTLWGIQFEDNNIMSAFGLRMGFFVKNGKIVYGQAQPEFKDYLALMNRWYKEKLLDPNFQTNDQTAMNTNILNDRSGVYRGWLFGSMGLYLAQKKGTRFDLIGLQIPVLKKGDQPQFSAHVYVPFEGQTAAVTTACKQPQLAAKFYDWRYTPEGHNIITFGVEGKSYTVVNGEYKLTPEIISNPNKLSLKQALKSYTFNSISAGRFSDDQRIMDAQCNWPQQVAAFNTWRKYADNYVKAVLPPITPSPDESKEMATIMNEVKTYHDEMIIKMIMGTEPLANFDKYLEQMNKLGLKRALEIQQAALARYEKR